MNITREKEILVAQNKKINSIGRKKIMDWKRVSSALLGLPLVIVVILFGNQVIIDIAMSLVAIISLNEYFNAFKEKYNPIQWIAYLLAFGICFLHLIPQFLLFYYLSLGIPIIILILFAELIIKNLKINVIDIMITLFGIFYIVLFIMFIPLITALENGKILIWYAILASWGTDVFAYLVGKTLKLGKHKFSKISPNKSIEGCIAGLIGAIIISLIYTLIINKVALLNISYIKILIVSAVLSIVGQFGDFSASSIKRFAGIKDYSNLIPGHGGLLDRIDSLIFTAPITYILLMFF